ncbi:MAG: putative Ig domain-containing protein [Pseudomonadota bacterium]
MTLPLCAARMTSIFGPAMLALCLFALAACGGGGSGCSGTITYDSYGYSGARDGEVGQPMSLTLDAHVASGNCSPQHRLTGTLPPGLSFNKQTGQIAGTPTAGGVYALTVQPDVASSDVGTTLTLTVQPVGRQTAEMSPVLLDTPSGFSRRSGVDLAVTSHAGSMRIWLGGYINTGAGHFELFRSDDDGRNWVVDDADQLITARGDTLGAFLVAASGARAYVMEAGASRDMQPIGNVLYRFDGTSWAVQNDALPFTAPYGTKLQALSDGSLAVSWGGPTGTIIWTSSDEGLHWTSRSASGGLSPDAFGNLALCTGRLNDDWYAVGWGSSWHLAVLPEDTFFWAPETTWPWYGYMYPSPVCASDGTNLWVTGQPADLTTSPLSISDIVHGETSFAFPRRLSTLVNGAPFVSLAADAGHLYGLEDPGTEITGYRLWKLK